MKKEIIISELDVRYARGCLEYISDTNNQGNMEYERIKDNLDYLYEKYGKDVILEKIAEFNSNEEKLKTNLESCDPEIVANRLISDWGTLLSRRDLSENIVHVISTIKSTSDEFKKKVVDVIPSLIERERQNVEDNGPFYKGYIDDYIKTCKRACSELGFELPSVENGQPGNE